ncbi:hypothetical protein O3P69_008101 [Scylla paramamosain]|uniref:Uncharacterized protein n=1 Tax=Scylla paramamosain TaxID=85552 RepID=A0AAW0T1U6_SCYPA
MAGYLALRSMEENGKTTQGGGGAAGEEEDHFKQELLVAVQTGDEEKLRHALKHLPPKAVNHVFPHPVSATALHVATQNNSFELVKALLEVPADTGARDWRGKKYCPLHYAAHNGNVEVLEALLKAGADPNAKEGEFGRTSLHILANRWKNNEDSYKACLDALLSCKRIKVDALDSSKATPLFMAATKGWEYMVRKLINMGANINAAVGNKTASDVIKKKFNDLLDTIDFSVIQKPKRYFSDELYDALINTDLQLFQEILNEIDNSEEKSKVSALEEDHGEYTLLQYACDNGLADFVEELLKNGANAARKDETSLMSPVLYAARNGYHKILEMLLRTLKEQKELDKGVLRHKDLRKETVLHKVIKREYAAKQEGVNYYMCLELLLEKKRYLDLDAQDEFGNTALHYAVLCDDQSFVRILLLNGAHLGIRNQFGTLAITRIQASVLEEVLNDCIKYKHNVADREFEIILYYSMLAPAQTSQQPETECLRFLSGSREIEYTDLPLAAFPVSSHLLFVVFVFLIVLVLMNLLNGLAVSDIQQIQQEAEIVSYSSRVELVSYIESVFLASPLHQIFPGSLRCCEGGDEKDDCYLRACIESHNPAIRLLNWLGRRTLMFQTCLRNPWISVYPNRGRDRWHVCDCHSFHLKEAQIEAAKDVVLEKEHAVDTHRLSGLENRLDEVMAAISSLTDKVNKHVLCPSPE